MENEKYAGDLLMQKWYVEDYLTHKCVKNMRDRPQYFVEDDHDPIVPKAVQAEGCGDGIQYAAFKARGAGGTAGAAAHG